MKELEKILFAEAKIENLCISGIPLVFILASPRTGSTLLYQLMINHFTFYYFRNFINDYFSKFPALGVLLGASICKEPRRPISHESSYGKTEGAFGPSEASFIFRNWFGGDHPSELRSCNFESAERMVHMVHTMKTIWRNTSSALLMKNAWNCFRIKVLSEVFPQAYFIWLRRDIVRSALSDLKAREYQGSFSSGVRNNVFFTYVDRKTKIWNSATTANYKEIQKLLYWEQVVEQQYEYNKVIGRDLNQYCPDRYFEIWYEDVCDCSDDIVAKLASFFSVRHLPIYRVYPRMLPGILPRKPETIDEDRERILTYVNANKRFISFQKAEK